MLFAASCESVPNETLLLMAPDGAPGVVVSKIASDGNIGRRSVTTNIVSGASEIKINVANGNADMAVMPLNLAAQLYNAGTEIQLVSVNIFGSLYMVGKEQINGLNDLVGEVVYNIGQGGTPDLTFKYILEQSGIEFVLSETPVEGKVALHYVAAASDLMPLFITGAAKFGIMGEPAVTLCNNKTGTQTVLNVQEEWKRVTGESYTQAGFVVKKALAEDIAFMTKLNATLSENNVWCKDNAASLKAILTGKGSTIALEYTPELIDRCNVGYVSAGDAKADIEQYFNVLMGFKPALIGGKLPDDGFYYGL